METVTIPPGYCDFRGERMSLLDVPEWAHAMDVYDKNGARTGETIGDLVAAERKRIRFQKRICDDWRCGWRGNDSEVLRAPDPFNAGTELTACPKCREQTIRTCCDEPDCWKPDTCGTPTPDGYRRTCGDHIPRLFAHA